MTAINSNRAIRGPVTAVPVVAGKGVRLVADTENNRWVVEADETVLYENASGFKYGDAAVQLSEAITNFSEVRLYLKGNTSSSFPSSNTNFVIIFGMLDNSGVWPKIATASISISGTTMTYVANRVQGGGSTTPSHYSNVSDSDTQIVKVVGVNRIASN